MLKKANTLKNRRKRGGKTRSNKRISRRKKGGSPENVKSICEDLEFIWDEETEKKINTLIPSLSKIEKKTVLSCLEIALYKVQNYPNTTGFMGDGTMNYLQRKNIEAIPKLKELQTRLNPAN